MKLIRDGEEFVIKNIDCKFEYQASFTENSVVTELYIREKEFGRTLMYLDIEKTCLGVVKAILELYGFKIEKA